MVNDNIVFICQPPARLAEAETEMPHHKVDGAAAGPADKAAEAIPAHRKRQTRMMIVVERAEALVPHHPQSESLRDP